VQGLAFVLRQIVPLIVDDQVKLSASGRTVGWSRRNRPFWTRARSGVMSSLYGVERCIGKPAVGQSRTRAGRSLLVHSRLAED
jgi:hypothetical protein